MYGNAFFCSPLLLSTKRAGLVLGMAGLCFVVAAAGCSRQGKAAPVGGSTVPPSQVKLKRKVDLARAEQRAIEYNVETTGYLEAEGHTDIAAGVTGVVDEVLFREGQRVTPDTVLVKIDQRRYLSAAEVARANEKRAEAAVALARDQAGRGYRIGAAALSDEERNKLIFTLQMAEAELASARANRALAEHYLERSQVRAPYFGQINLRKVTPGTYLEEKTPIATMADLSRLRLVGWVPEKAAPMVRGLIAASERIRATHLTGGWFGGPAPWGGLAGLLLDSQNQVPGTFTLEFHLLAYPNHVFRGRVFYMSTVADPDTHMFQCRAEVNANVPGGEELRPGFTAQIIVHLKGNPNACIVPEEAIRSSERGCIAFVPQRRTGRDGNEEWVARARTVERGYSTPKKKGEREIWVEIREGIQPGEWVVRRGAEALEDGTPIDPPAEQLKQLENQASANR
jgi:multidrug efflux system membrane fusion protein